MSANTIQQNYFTVSQFAKEKRFIKEPALRYLIFNANKNGFNRVIKRMGKRILIDYNAFENWLQENNREGN